MLTSREVRAFGYGMSPEADLQFQGPYVCAVEFYEAIVEAGEEYGLKWLGSKMHVANSVRLGWIAPFIKPVCAVPEMKEYR